MKIIISFLITIIIVSCGESKEEKMLKDQKHINAIIDLKMKRLNDNLEMIEKRGELEIAMLKAGYSKDSINKKIKELEIRDSLRLDKLYDTTLIID